MTMQFTPESMETDRRAVKLMAREGMAGFADVFRELTAHSNLVLDDGAIETATEGSDSGVSLRVCLNGSTASTALASPPDNLVLATANDLAAAAGVGESGAADFALRGDYSPLEPINRTLKEKAALAGEIDRAVRSLDPKIVQVRVSYRDYARLILVTRNDGIQVGGGQRGFYLSVLVTVADRGKAQTGFDALGGSTGWELFERQDPVEAALNAARRALTMLKARRPPSGALPVVMAARAGGTMIHEAVGHGLEADLFCEGHSIYGDRIGEAVASKLITVIDDPTLPGRRGSYAIDDEGTGATPTVLIDGGVLRRLLHSRETAMKSGLMPSANGRRESWRVTPIPRMSNTMIAPGVDDPASIIADTHKGLYVTRMGGGQVDTVSGDFVFEVEEGFLIQNGKIGDPVRGATIAGNGPEALMAVDRVGSDLGFSIGTCGKDGQGAPVADAQPTIRIPELVVGG